MTRPVLATAALVVIVATLGAALLLGRGPSANVGGPSTSPSPSATAVPTVAGSPTPTAAAAGPLPGQLVHRWMGGSRTLTGISAVAGTSIIFDASGFAMSQSNGNSTPAITASATVGRLPDRAPRVRAL